MGKNEINICVDPVQSVARHKGNKVYSRMVTIEIGGVTIDKVVSNPDADKCDETVVRMLYRMRDQIENELKWLV